MKSRSHPPVLRRVSRSACSSRQARRATASATYTVLAVLLTALASVCAHAAADADTLRGALSSEVRNKATFAFLPLRGQPATGPLQALYVRREFNPLWSHDSRATSQALALVQELRAAAAYGLRAQDYGGSLIAGLLVNPQMDPILNRARWARFDVSLSAAALQFLTDLHSGRVDPRAAGFQLETARPELDLGAVLEKLANAPDIGVVISAVEPPFYHYRLLKQALARYQAIAARTDLAALAQISRKIQPGDSYPSAPTLRRLLSALGDLPVLRVAPSSALIFDTDLSAGLRKFQQRHGLAADGVLGKSTYAALSKPLTQGIRQIELTLERWRWLPAFETPPIIVNIPQFRLFAFRSTEDRSPDILQMDVIVGQTYARTQTPVFAADMKYVIFRPYWDIPHSIMLREMLPKIRLDLSYFAEQHLQIVREQTDAAIPLPPTAENLDALASGRLRLRQLPGPDNALGLIKFMLPNSHNVYLHATPVQRLFGASRRAFSHGCIRVSDPVALAVHVLKNTAGEWTAEKIQAAMDGLLTQHVTLEKPIRVMILYATVLATESGAVLFFDDIYGHDRKLETLLGLSPVK